MARVIPFILVIAVTIYAVIDCARTPKESLPGPIPKIFWLLGIVVFMPLGGIAWIVISRVFRAEAQGEYKPTLWSSPDASPEFQRFRRPDPQEELRQEIQNAPDNDPDYLFKIEAEIQRRKMEAEAEKSGKRKPKQEKPSGDDKELTGKPAGKDQVESASPGKTEDEDQAGKTDQAENTDQAEGSAEAEDKQKGTD